jgi:hypothetical protein
MRWKGAFDYCMTGTVLCMQFLEERLVEVSDAYNSFYRKLMFHKQIQIVLTKSVQKLSARAPKY